MTSMLSAGDLISMQAVLNRTMPDSAVIQRKTTVSDGQGGGSATWAAVGTVACRLSPLPTRRTDMEETHAASIRAVRERILTTPASTDISETDRVVVSTITYEVTAMNAPRSWELSRRCMVARI